MIRTFLNVVAIAALLGFAGCTMLAPKYNPDFDNVGTLKAADLNTARVGAVTSAPKSDVESVKIRLSPLTSPYGTFAAYLQAALRQELDEARLLDANSPYEVTAELQTNDVEAKFEEGKATVTARFVVKKEGTVRYDKVVTATHTWESSFVGAVAIPKAQQEYSNAVKVLLATLYRDKDFLAALKK